MRKGNSDVSKFYITTDGYFTNRSDIKKKRIVAVLEQRKSDGAVAVVKVYSKEGKEQKIGKTFIPGLTLQPHDHPSLSKESIVGRQVVFGRKSRNTIRAIYPDDFNDTTDSLSKKELKIIRKAVHNDTKQHRASYKHKKKRWKKHFNTNE